MRDVKSSVGIVKGKSVMSSLGFPWWGRGSAAFPRLWINTAPPMPEKIAEAVVKVLGMHYDREEMRRYAFGKFGAENVERLIDIFNEVTGSRG